MISETQINQMEQLLDARGKIDSNETTILFKKLHNELKHLATGQFAVLESEIIAGIILDYPLNKILCELNTNPKQNGDYQYLSNQAVLMTVVRFIDNQFSLTFNCVHPLFLSNDLYFKDFTVPFQTEFLRKRFQLVILKQMECKLTRENIIKFYNKNWSRY